MTTLQVRLEAGNEPVGFLQTNDDGAVIFAYNDVYLAARAPRAISLSLPLREQAYIDGAARAFFANLLPENDQLDFILAREGIESGDVVGILAHLGADLSGALSCLPLDAAAIKYPGQLAEDYLDLSDEDLTEIVQRLGERRALPEELRDPSPVAGYQRKIALVERADGGFAIPRSGSGVPTTHILKVPDTTLPREAFYESTSARLASLVGLNVAPSRSFWQGDYEVLLAKRFDRIVTQDGSVHRLHQEDFAQALGLPPRFKYERYGQGQRIFSATAIAGLLRETAAPAHAIRDFLRALFFNLAIGNTDNHAKNHALLYSDSATPSLAPLYDLVPIRLSDQVNHLLAFSIGTAATSDAITTDDLRQCLAAFDLSSAAARRFWQGSVAGMLETLAAEREVTGEWAVRFDKLIRSQARGLADIGARL